MEILAEISRTFLNFLLKSLEMSQSCDISRLKLLFLLVER